MTSRYIIGIDLGTTNTAVAYVDTQAGDARVQIFEVMQLVAPGEVADRKQLPSFVYLPGEHDLSRAETTLPWDDSRRMVVGELAREQGARVASRMISSAKSWLCHAGVDRRAQILPWGSDTEPKLSPINASAMILRHVQEAWNHAFQGDDAMFAEQEVIVTVPASFDEAARELTLDAATAAGMENIILLEEPQAAFYAWIDAHPPGQRKMLAAGNTVLVFDVGGGTTDFTVIRVGEDGDSFERTAVGDHLLLGGDNIDLTLAKIVEARMTSGGGKKLDALQWYGLVHACRTAKEKLLTSPETTEVPISVAGRGSKLIGGARKDRVDRAELETTILGGFFPEIPRSEHPKRIRGGLTEFGLPYAADAGITRHLAQFLERREIGHIDAVLFNGGAMTPELLRTRVVNLIGSWQGRLPRELSNTLPELAVGRGAAYYGLVRRGLGSRIRGGTPRSFYIGVDAQDGEAMAVCLASKGIEEGSKVELSRDFQLVTNRPVSFKLYSSTTRSDAPGDLVHVGDGRADTIDDGSDLLELPSIVTVLRAPGRSKVTVHVEVGVTELGALEIHCVSHDKTDERWRLSFDMRTGGAASKDDGVTGDLDPKIGTAQQLITRAFEGDLDVPVKTLMRALEDTLESRRDEWSLTVTRALFDAALKVEDARKSSPDFEARWMHLAGYCLRPGNGAPLDTWRSKQMWRLFNAGITHERHEQVRLAWWITWRRIAGGLSKGQQEQLYDRLAQLFLPSKAQKKKWYKIKPTKQEAAEMWRVLANLERIAPEFKALLGDELVRRMESNKGLREALHFWALGRIGARAPLYGPLNSVVHAAKVEEWLAALVDRTWPDPEMAAFPMAQLARKTGDRSRDIDDDMRAKLAAKLREFPGGERTAKLVEDVVALEAREERVLLGDTLPAGLRLLGDADQER